MKSIQTKFISLILGCVLICSTVIGGAEILSSKQVIENYSAQLMNRICSEKSLELDALLGRADIHLAIARGIAIYNSETDLVFANVFKRADDAMYQNKAMMKQRELQNEGIEDLR